MSLTNSANAYILITMTIETEQKTPKHREPNGLHDDVVNLKVDVATLKEQGKHFATKEDIAKLEAQNAKLEAQIAKLEAQIAKNQAENKQAMAAMDHKIEKAKNEMLYAFNRAAVGMIVFLGGILVTLILK